MTSRVDPPQVKFHFAFVLGMGILITLYLETGLFAASPPENRFEREVDALVKESEKASPECQKFAKKVRQFSGIDIGHPNPEPWTAAQGEQARNLIRAYPGTPQGSFRALSRILKEATGPKVIDRLNDAWLMGRLHQLEFCDKAGQFQLFSRMIQYLGEHVDDRDQNGLRQEILKSLMFHMKRELGQTTTLFSVMVQISLIEKMLEAGLFQHTTGFTMSREKQARLRAIIKDFDRYFESKKVRFKDSTPTHFVGGKNDVIEELRETDRFRRRTYEILALSQ